MGGPAMGEKHEHHRDSEVEDYQHRRTEDFAIPESAKWIAAFINRIGFPIFAFCVLSYFYFVGLQKNTAVIGELRDVMLSVKVSLDAPRR